MQARNKRLKNTTIIIVWGKINDIKRRYAENAIKKWKTTNRGHAACKKVTTQVSIKQTNVISTWRFKVAWVIWMTIEVQCGADKRTKVKKTVLRWRRNGLNILEMAGSARTVLGSICQRHTVSMDREERGEGGTTRWNDIAEWYTEYEKLYRHCSGQC